MFTDIVAGGIFSTQETIVYFGIYFAIVGTIAGVLIYSGKFLLGRFSQRIAAKKLSFEKALGFGFLLLTLGCVLFVIFIKIVESGVKQKQIDCSKQAGYIYGQDNAAISNSETETIYRRCMGYDK